MVKTSQGYSAPLQAGESSAAPAKVKKRPSAPGAADPSTPGHAAQGPHQLSFQSVNDPDPIRAQPSAAHSPRTTSGKKRGRPTKVEMEKRAIEAAERGEIYPPPKKVKAKQRLEGAAPGSMVLTPGGPDDPAYVGGLTAEATPSGSAPKKRTPKPKGSKEARQNLEATAGAANALGFQGEVQPDPVIPEKRDEAHGLPEEGLLSGLQEHAELGGPIATEATTPMQPQQEPAQQPQPQSERQLSPQAEAEAYQTPYQQHSAI